ncbi:hypothetical protein [Peribacillus kribbensis]|uniref:hypothetical protein n=1 Tax=Peribacillus kribbensis TaxID=356658 RepID=UPI0003F650F0|nr:hypothetical protein [Peribacillus kribbensis]
MGLLTRYNKVCETSDKQRMPELRTHYYKASSNKTFSAVEDMLNSMQSCRIINVSKEHGEISAEIQSSPQAFLVATIVSVQPNETAVDLIISSEKISLTGIFPSLKRIAVSVYERLDQILPFVSSGRN